MLLIKPWGSFSGIPDQGRFGVRPFLAGKTRTQIRRVQKTAKTEEVVREKLGSRNRKRVRLYLLQRRDVQRRLAKLAAVPGGQQLLLMRRRPFQHHLAHPPRRVALNDLQRPDAYDQLCVSVNRLKIPPETPRPPPPDHDP